jgi:hypothetical protein
MRQGVGRRAAATGRTSAAGFFVCGIADDGQFHVGLLWIWGYAGYSAIAVPEEKTAEKQGFIVLARGRLSALCRKGDSQLCA